MCCLGHVHKYMHKCIEETHIRAPGIHGLVDVVYASRWLSDAFLTATIQIRFKPVPCQRLLHA